MLLQPPTFPPPPACLSLNMGLPIMPLIYYCAILGRKWAQNAPYKNFIWRGIAIIRRLNNYGGLSHQEFLGGVVLVCFAFFPGDF